MAEPTQAQAGGSLHDHALQAEKHAEQLATGLAQAGADPNTVKAVSKAADLMRQIVSALGKGQEQTGDNEPPAPQPQQPQGRPTMDDGAAAVQQAAQQGAQQRQNY